MVLSLLLKEERVAVPGILGEIVPDIETKV